ncbi:HNH endonuclease signature motif containing protein [Sporosarcina sp. USHLN248]|uniref:HNH endonuclease n=1 Tax=Sporosarcina sp. USHLN248 TaxID=3081300 RepID=UPI003018CBC4
MARPRNYNPLVYVVNQRNLSRAKNKGEKQFKAYLRNCGSNYIKRPEVRQCILDRYNHQCAECEATQNLQVDHIISVYQGWKQGLDIEVINTLENLQILCRSCNASKLP